MKKRLIVWTFGLLVITVALQVSLIRAAAKSESLQEILVASRLFEPGESLTLDALVIVRISESSVMPWMLKASEVSFPVFASRQIEQGEILTQDSLGAASSNLTAQVALKIEPQDAVAFQLSVGERIELMAIHGKDQAAHFKGLTISQILGQDLMPAGLSQTQPAYLILKGEKKEILALCRIKSTHTFQVIK